MVQSGHRQRSKSSETVDFVKHRATSRQVESNKHTNLKNQQADMNGSENTYGNYTK